VWQFPEQGCALKRDQDSLDKFLRESCALQPFMRWARRQTVGLSRRKGATS